MKTELLFSTARQGKYLYQGEDLSTAAFAMLDDALKTYPNDEDYTFIKDELEKQKDPHEWTWERINFDWGVSPDFAERLKPLDIVYPRTFAAKTKAGEAFIELFEYADSLFMLNARTWIGSDTLRLEFVLCNIETRQKLLRDFYAGKVTL